MTARKKKIITEIIILVICILVIIIGGRYERGYFAVASEPFVAAFGILVILISNKK